MGQVTHDLPLPAGIRTRRVAGINGLTTHMLEAGDADRPCVLLLHGFPELAYSWRKVMLPLAEAGYYVIAPDQRGYTPGARYDLGMAYLAKDMPAEAAVQLERAVATHPGHVPSLVALGRALQRLEQPVRGIETLQTAARLDPPPGDEID